MMFSPAYVTAYSLKLDFVGNSTIVVILLSLFSNTVLVFFIQKFYITLKKEYEKGYVTTAMLKGLNNEYQLNNQFFRFRTLLKPFRKFEGHAFDHVYKNSIIQFISILKEAIPILLTSLIIVEMALNVQGSLCYDLLIKLNNLSFIHTFIIIFLIYIGLKSVEFVVELMELKIREKYENK